MSKEAVKQRRKKKTVQELLKSKRRDQRKKGQRLAKRALSETAVRHLSHQRTYANVQAVRRPGEVVFGMRTGLFGHPTTTVLKVEDEKIVGACEDIKELGEVVTQLGMLTLASLVNYNLAWGPDGLAKALARWANIDLEKLKAEADAEDEPTHDDCEQCTGNPPDDFYIDDPTPPDESPEPPAETEL